MKKDKDKREIMVAFRVSEKEMKQLRKKAEEQHLTPSTLARCLVFKEIYV